MDEKKVQSSQGYLKFREVQSKPSKIRHINVCGHTKHGKTSLVDCLQIKNKMHEVAQMHSLDGHYDDVQYGTTVRSLMSTAYHTYTTENKREREPYLVYVTDTPSHEELVAEVISSASVADGTLIVVSVTEGLCSGTITALKAAIKHKSKTILVLNHMDRLFCNKMHTTEKIYHILNNLIESVNSAVYDIIANIYACSNTCGVPSEDFDGKFDPVKRNVIFASILHGWAFRIVDFARLYHADAGKTCSEMEMILWKDYFYAKPSDKIVQGVENVGQAYIFSGMILHRILFLYKNILSLKLDEEGFLKIIRGVFYSWIPVDKTFLDAIVELVPAPNNLPKDKLEYILQTDKITKPDKECSALAHAAIEKCSPSTSAPTVAFMKKMGSLDCIRVDHEPSKGNKIKIANKQTYVDEAEKSKILKLWKYPTYVNLTESRTLVNEGPCGSNVVAWVRIYSGEVKLGDTLYFIPFNHSPAKLNSTTSPKIFNNLMQKIIPIKVTKLFTIFGNYKTPVDSIGAGNIAGIGNVSEHVIRQGTLCSNLDCFPLADYKIPTPKICYNVAVEPMYPTHMTKLLLGMKLLVQTNTNVLGMLQRNGQFVLNCNGAHHAAVCIDDLHTYTGLEFKVAPPFVQLRETLDLEEQEVISSGDCYLEEYGVTVMLQVTSMSAQVRKFLSDNFDVLKKIEHASNDELCEGVKEGDLKEFTNSYRTVVAQRLRFTFDALFEDYKNYPASNRLIGLSSRQDECCMLINLTKENIEGVSLFHKRKDSDATGFMYVCMNQAFKQFTRYGPLCDEPLKNCIIYVRNLSLSKKTKMGEVPMSPYLITATFRDLMQQVAMYCQPRLMEPFYSTTITVENAKAEPALQLLKEHRGSATLVVKSKEGERTNIHMHVPVLEASALLDHLQHLLCEDLQVNWIFSQYVKLPDDPLTSEGSVAQKLMLQARMRKALPADDPPEYELESSPHNYNFIGDLYKNHFTYEDSIDYTHWTEFVEYFTPNEKSGPSEQITESQDNIRQHVIQRNVLDLLPKDLSERLILTRRLSKQKDDEENFLNTVDEAVEMINMIEGLCTNDNDLVVDSLNKMVQSPTVENDPCLSREVAQCTAILEAKDFLISKNELSSDVDVQPPKEPVACSSKTPDSLPIVEKRDVTDEMKSAAVNSGRGDLNVEAGTSVLCIKGAQPKRKQRRRRGAPKK